MSATKRYLEDEIAKLAEETEYDEEFLWDKFSEFVLNSDETDAWETFVGRTKEKDW